MHYDPYSAQNIRHLLQQEGLWLSKSRGQNYLTSQSVARQIQSFVPGTTQSVLEIGSGLGALTLPLVEQFDTTALEIDSGIVQLLQKRFTHPRLRLIHADFLKWDLDALPAPQTLVSNVPYSISGACVRRFLETACFDQAIFMLQKEFIDRLLAQPGNKTYALLSVLAQLYLDIDPLLKVDRSQFFPQPTVDSVVVRLRKKACPAPFAEMQAFLPPFFQSKRKKLRLGIQARFAGTADHAQAFWDKRPDALDASEWLQLFQILHPLWGRDEVRR